MTRTCRTRERQKQGGAGESAAAVAVGVPPENLIRGVEKPKLDRWAKGDGKFGDKKP